MISGYRPWSALPRGRSRRVRHAPPVAIAARRRMSSRLLTDDIPIGIISVASNCPDIFLTFSRRHPPSPAPRIVAGAPPASRVSFRCSCAGLRDGVRHLSEGFSPVVVPAIPGTGADRPPTPRRLVATPARSSEGRRTIAAAGEQHTAHLPRKD